MSVALNHIPKSASSSVPYISWTIKFKACLTVHVYTQEIELVQVHKGPQKTKTNPVA